MESSGEEQGVYGPAGDIDASPAFLFLCVENGRYAVSFDRRGGNLPREHCSTGWDYVRQFALGVKEALPIAADPEPILAGLVAEGYYVLRADTSLASLREIAGRREA